MKTTARLLSHSRSPMPRRAAWTTPGAVAVSLGVAVSLAVTLLVPAIAYGTSADGNPAEAAQQSRRAKDLSLLETALAETIQEAIEGAVRAINTSNTQPAPEAEAGGIRVTFTFRTSSQTHARGMFLEGYGVIFTVQVPTLTTSTAYYLSTDESGINSYLIAPRPDTWLAQEMAREIQIRSQLAMIEREIGELRGRIETELEDETGDEVQQVEQKLIQMQRLAGELNAEVAALRSRRSATERSGEQDRRSAVGVRPPRSGAYLATLDSEGVARAREASEAGRNDIEAAVIESVLETLAQYGRIMHGLADSDRLAVVLLPSSYLNEIQRWLRATNRAEEVVISVPFSDIQALDRGDIDEEEFLERVRIETRLGVDKEGLDSPRD